MFFLGNYYMDRRLIEYIKSLLDIIIQYAKIDANRDNDVDMSYSDDIYLGSK